MTRPAVFLDRDGTLVDDPGFLKHPGDVRLLPGAATAIRTLADAGYAVVVVTNQSGIGRGLLTVEDYRAVEQRVADLLAAEGAALDGTYFCPHSPVDDHPCDCRKPGTRLYHASGRDLELNLADSWWVGDRISDLEPAGSFGGRAILVLTGHGVEHRAAARERGVPEVADLLAAAQLIATAGGPGGD